MSLFTLIQQVPFLTIDAIKDVMTTFAGNEIIIS